MRFHENDDHHPNRRKIDMAAFDTTRAQFETAGFAGRIGQTFATLAAAVVAWNDDRVTRNALNGLTERELEDIGLSRFDVDNIR
jgi:uncharacterized protein YjiS (DUF1127 family)